MVKCPRGNFHTACFLILFEFHDGQRSFFLTTTEKRSKTGQRSWRRVYSIALYQRLILRCIFRLAEYIIVVSRNDCNIFQNIYFTNVYSKAFSKVYSNVYSNDFRDKIRLVTRPSSFNVTFDSQFTPLSIQILPI